ILRLVEQHGARGPVTVTLDRPLAAIEACDLLERPEPEKTPEVFSVGDHAFATALRPFEIQTLRLRFGR
ncbi:MAG: glycosyl hydrolase-related protein, partial [Planctomycetota bacterium]